MLYDSIFSMIWKPLTCFPLNLFFLTIQNVWDSSEILDIAHMYETRPQTLGSSLAILPWEGPGPSQESKAESYLAPLTYVKLSLFQGWQRSSLPVWLIASMRLCRWAGKEHLDLHKDNSILWTWPLSWFENGKLHFWALSLSQELCWPVVFLT